jgi:hypothetical protein
MSLWQHRGRILLFLLLAGATAGVLSQCILLPEEGLIGEPVANQRPLARITAGVLEDSVDAPTRVHFYWYGADPDGVVRWFEWAIDDTLTERAWTRTAAFDATISFQAATPSSGDDFADWHTFFLRGVDNERARSKPDKRYFNAHTIAPTSRIVSPQSQETSTWASTLRITWEGEDLDGSRADHLPAWFEYKLVRFEFPINPGDQEKVTRAFAESTNVFCGDLDPSDFPPDSLGTYFEQARRSWTRVDASQTEAWLYNLDIGKTYGFALRAIDEAGAVEVEFARNSNWVFFRVGNQRIRVTLCEPSLGCEVFNNASFESIWNVSVGPDQPIRFRWEGDASGTGSDPGPSNYGFDIPDPSDESRRDVNGIGGWIGWGNWAQMRQPISFPHSEEGKTHYFYLKMRDITNLDDTETDCTVAINVARLSFSRKFLIVDDLFRAPKPCVGSPPDDERTDAYRLRTFADAMGEFLPTGETWDEYRAFGDEIYGDPVELPDDFLETLGTFQNVIWDCGSGQPVGFIDALGRGSLARYTAAGGNLILLCDRGPVSQTTVCKHTQLEPCCPHPELYPGEFWTRGAGFLWETLRLQGCIDKPRHPSGSERDMAPQSLVRAEALHHLYPDLVLDPDRWVCGSLQKGTIQFEGLVPNEDEPEDDPWYEREVNRGGMQLLYQARTLQPGSATDSIPIAWRTFPPLEDSHPGTTGGRIVTFAFHPHFFHEDNVRSAMTFALRWLVTGND